MPKAAAVTQLICLRLAGGGRGGEVRKLDVSRQEEEAREREREREREVGREGCVEGGMERGMEGGTERWRERGLERETERERVTWREMHGEGKPWRER